MVSKLLWKLKKFSTISIDSPAHWLEFNLCVNQQDRCFVQSLVIPILITGRLLPKGTNQLIYYSISEIEAETVGKLNPKHYKQCNKYAAPCTSTNITNYSGNQFFLTRVILTICGTKFC